MMKLVSEYVTVIIEKTRNYEYQTRKDFSRHTEEMRLKEFYVEVWHECKDGRIVATYIKNEECEVK